MEAAIESVGAGLRPRPLSREGGDCRRIRRGRPMCRPGHGFSRNLLTGGHIGPPLRGVGRCSEPTEIGAGRKPSPTGRDGARPLPGSRSRAVRPGRRGVVTPPYGSNAGGAQRRADVPKAWLPPAKFRAEIWGVSHGHRPLRPAGGREGGTPGSSCPTGGCGEPPRLPWVAAHSGVSAPAGARDGWESR